MWNLKERKAACINVQAVMALSSFQSKTYECDFPIIVPNWS